MLPRLVIALATLLLSAGAAFAQGAGGQTTQCPLVSGMKQIDHQDYKVSTDDFCWWIILTNPGSINVTLPAPGLIFPPGFNTVLLPIDGGSVNFIGGQDDAGNVHKINGNPSLSLDAGQGAQLKIQEDGNWYALTTGGGGGGGGGGPTQLNAVADLPTLSAGLQTPQGSLAGAAYVQPVFGSASGGGTIVDAAHPLPVTSISPQAFGVPFPSAGQAAGVRGSNGNMNWLSTDASGALIVGAPTGNPLNVNISSGSGVSTFGSLFPAVGAAAGYRDPNGNMHFGSVNIAGQFLVDHSTLDVVGPGTSTGALRMAISSDSGANTVTLSQSPLTNIGTVNQGAPVAAASAWPTAIYAGPNQLAINGSGQLSCSNCSATGPAQDMVVGPATLTAGGSSILAASTQGSGAATVVLTGASVLTANFEGLTPAGWSSIAMDNITTGQTQSTATANGIWQTNPAGYSQIRVNVQSGSVTASIESSTGSLPTGIDSAVYIATPPTLSNGSSAGMTMTNDERLRVSLDTATTTDRSAAIATGGVSQTLFPANANRRGILIENPCTASSQGIGSTENIFYNFTSAASPTAGNSIELVPCGSYSPPGPVTPEAITVVAATSGHKVVAKEF